MLLFVIEMSLMFSDEKESMQLRHLSFLPLISEYVFIYICPTSALTLTMPKLCINDCRLLKSVQKQIFKYIPIYVFEVII